LAGKNIQIEKKKIEENTNEPKEGKETKKRKLVEVSIKPIQVSHVMTFESKCFRKRAEKQNQK
jgi:hypothetical protein